MLRNPAYKGKACFGKTQIVERQKITRPLRKRGGFSPRCGANRERPRQDWIEIPVPALVNEEVFALAEERLEHNKRYSLRRTIEPTLLQGMLVCSQCGYAYYRTSTRTSKRKLYYYRCLGSDDYRYENGRVCKSQPIRQDYLDVVVWEQVIKLLEDPEIVRSEIRRRIKEIHNASPIKKRKETLEKAIIRVNKSIEKLLDAYQEDLLQLDELRSRMPALRKREAALKSELNSIESAASDQHAILRVANNIDNFLFQLCKTADTMEVLERQKVLRLVVKEVLVDDETINIKHSVPFALSSKTNLSLESAKIPSYLLRSGSHHTPLGRSLLSFD
jgi:site-specific DNA recombinase